MIENEKKFLKSKSFLFKVILLLTLSCIFSLWTFNQYYPTANESRHIQICKNQLEFHNEIAVWTFLTDDIQNYGTGAVKLLKSIQMNVKTSKFDAILLELIQKPIEAKIRENITKAGWRICQVNRIAPRDEANTFGRFRDQFTKLLLWKALEYKANYYFDSDALVIRNVDTFFKIHSRFDPDLHKIGCTMDIRASVWQKSFNMGVFVIKPSHKEFDRLLKLKNDINFQFEAVNFIFMVIIK